MDILFTALIFIIMLLFAKDYLRRKRSKSVKSSIGIKDFNFNLSGSNLGDSIGCGYISPFGSVGYKKAVEIVDKVSFKTRDNVILKGDSEDLLEVLSFMKNQEDQLIKITNKYSESVDKYSKLTDKYCDLLNARAAAIPKRPFIRSKESLYNPLLLRIKKVLDYDLGCECGVDFTEGSSSVICFPGSYEFYTKLEKYMCKHGVILLNPVNHVENNMYKSKSFSNKFTIRSLSIDGKKEMTIDLINVCKVSMSKEVIK